MHSCTFAYVIRYSSQALKFLQKRIRDLNFEISKKDSLEIFS